VWAQGRTLEVMSALNAINTGKGFCLTGVAGRLLIINANVLKVAGHSSS
jgi:hypothetical protein